MELIKNLFLRFRRAISFSLIGIINTGVDFLTFTICFELLNLTEGISHTLGYIAGVVCSFIMNRTITFKDGGRSLRFQMFLFIIINLISWRVTTSLIVLLTDRGLNAYLAKFFVTGISMLINYFGYKKLVFKVIGDGRSNADE